MIGVAVAGLACFIVPEIIHTGSHIIQDKRLDKEQEVLKATWAINSEIIAYQKSNGQLPPDLETIMDSISPSYTLLKKREDKGIKIEYTGKEIIIGDRIVYLIVRKNNGVLYAFKEGDVRHIDNDEA